MGSSKFYWGKRVAYIYKAHSLKNNTKFRVMMYVKKFRQYGDVLANHMVQMVQWLQDSIKTFHQELLVQHWEYSFIPIELENIII